MPQTVIRVFRTAANAVPLKEWLDQLEVREPVPYAKCLQRILQLEQFGYELRPPACDSLRDGIMELRAKAGRVNYRILYFFCGPNTACLSHGFTKEGKVPEKEMDLAVAEKSLLRVIETPIPLTGRLECATPRTSLMSFAPKWHPVPN
jgi:phage-related protein